MKTAVPVQTNSHDSKLSGHFGSAPFLAVFDDELGELSFLDRSQKQGGSCAPVDELAALGVQRVISLGMGRGAMNRLASAGIACSFVVKSPGTLDRFRTALAEGRVLLSDDAGVCAGHDHGHHHDHEHHGGEHHIGAGLGLGQGRGLGNGHCNH